MYRLADDVSPFNAVITFRLGLALERLGRPDEAIENYRRVTVIDPNHAGSHHRLCEMLRINGRSDDAIRHGERAQS